MNKLEALKKMTTIVADTGDIDSIKQYTPQDATTNPSLILKAVQQEKYHHLVEEALSYANKKGGSEKIDLLIDRLFVNFGAEILKLVPGRVSTEIEAKYSFDIEKSIQKAKAIVSLYKEKGVEQERLLIKLASTWEGIVAGRELEKEGIHVNMTLMFSLPQAIACADANVTLISPFVGRILDWYKAKGEKIPNDPALDPGVQSVIQIYNYYKKFDYHTQIMGASFRNTSQILELAGCDLLTISPSLLEELKEAKGPVEKKLSLEKAKQSDIKKQQIDEKTFRWLLNENAMATEKLAEGIRNFNRDTQRLKDYLKKNF